AVSAVEADAFPAPGPIVRLLRDREREGRLRPWRLIADRVAAPHPPAAAARIEAENPAVVLLAHIHTACSRGAGEMAAHPLDRQLERLLRRHPPERRIPLGDPLSLRYAEYLVHPLFAEPVAQ